MYTDATSPMRMFIRLFTTATTDVVTVASSFCTSCRKVVVIQLLMNS